MKQFSMSGYREWIKSGQLPRNATARKGTETQEEAGAANVPQKIFDTKKYSEWSRRSFLQKENREVTDRIQDFNKRLSTGSYMTADDLAQYQQDVLAYIETGDAMRKIAKEDGAEWDEVADANWQKTIAQLSTSVGKYQDMFSKYEIEEDWTKAWQENGWYTEYSDKSYTELMDIISRMEPGAEKEWLTGYAPSAREQVDFDTQIAEYEVAISEAEEMLEQYEWYGNTGDLENHARMSREIAAKYGGIDEARGFISTSKAEKASAVRDREAYMMGLVADETSSSYDPDFANFSGYRSTAESGENYDIEYETVNHAVSAVGWDTIDRDVRDLYYNPEDPYSIEAAQKEVARLSVLKGMTQEEVALYNYYYNTQGKSSASRYLESISGKLNAQTAAQEFETVKGQPWLELAYAGIIAANEGVEAIGNLFNVDGEYKAPSVNAYLSGMMREDMKDEFVLPEWAGGKAMGQIAYDAVYTTGNMLPSIMASMAVGTINPVAGKIAARAMLGASAAGNAYQQKINEGYTRGQAYTYGALIGASEVALESVLGGVEAFGAKGLTKAMEKLSAVDKVFAKIATSVPGRIFASGASEFFEEGLQSMIEPYIWQAVSGEKMEVNWEETLYNAVLGYIAGSTFAVTTPNTYTQVFEGIANQRTGNTILKEDGLADLTGLAGKIDSPKINRLLKSVSKKASAGKVGRLYSAVSEAVSKQNRLNLTNSLIQKGVNTETAGKLAEITTQWWAEGELSDAGLKLLSAAINDPKIAEAISEARDQMMPVIERLGQIREGKSAVSTATEEGKQNAAMMDEKEGVAFADTVTESGSFVDSSGTAVASVMESQVHNQQNLEEKTFLQSSGEEVQSVAYKSIDNGSVTVTVNGSTEAAAGDVSFSNEGDAVLFESIPAINHITAEGANVIWNAWKSGAHSNAGAFGGAAAQVFKAGYLGDATILNAGDSRAAALTSAQKYAIYQQGRKAAAADYDSKQAKRYADNKKPAKEKKGGVYYGYDGKTIDQRNDGKHKQLTKAQRVGVEFVKRLSKKFGSTVYFYESYVDENGSRAYKDRNGNIVAAEKGFYDPKDGSIHIDLNSGKVLYTIAHELVHFIRDWSPKHFKQMADIVMAGYSRENVPLDKLIADQQALAREHGRELTEDEAFEEVIANALEGIMADGKVAEFLRAIEGKDKGLGAKVRQFFQDIAKLIQDTLDAYAGVKPDSVEGKMTMQLEDVYRQLQQVFAEGVYDAGESFWLAGEDIANDGDLHYSKHAKVFFKENVFPPYNESHSEAHELAERWSLSDSAKVRNMRLISFHNNWYLIQAFDDLKYGYQIIRKLTVTEYKRESKYYDTITGYESLQDTSRENATLLRESRSTGKTRYRTNHDAVEYRGKNPSVYGVVTNQDSGRKIERNGGRNSGSSVENSRWKNGPSVTDSDGNELTTGQAKLTSNKNPTSNPDVRFSVQQKENATVADMLKKENEQLKAEESSGNEHLTDRQILEYALKTVDKKERDPLFLHALNPYERQVEHTKTTERLLRQLEEKQQQYQGINENTEEISRINGAISKLKSMLTTQEKRRTAAEKGKKLQKVIKILRSGLGKAQSTVENSRNKKLDNYRTNDKINADDGSQQGAVNRIENTTAQNKTLTAQDLLDRIDEFVDVRTLSGKQQNTLDAYNQQKQTISELEASRKTHENPDELDSQIAKAKENLQKIQARKVTKSIVNRAKQGIYREYVNATLEKFHLKDALNVYRAELSSLQDKLESGTTEIYGQCINYADLVANYEAKITQTEEALQNVEKELERTKAIAGTIIDAGDRNLLLFDDQQVSTVNGKRVITNNSFDLDIVDEEGRTNRQKMRQGYAPTNAEGIRYNIHHIDQTNDGTVLVIPESLHQKYDSMLHSNKGQSPSQIDRAAFAKWRRAFWKWLLQQLNE